MIKEFQNEITYGTGTFKTVQKRFNNSVEILINDFKSQVSGETVAYKALMGSLNRIIKTLNVSEERLKNHQNKALLDIRTALNVTIQNIIRKHEDNETGMQIELFLLICMYI